MMRGENLYLQQLFHGDQPGAHPIVHIVIVVSDLIGQIGDLGFQRRLRTLQEALAHIAQRARMAPRAMFENALARLEAQIQAVERRVALFQLVDHLQALQVVC
ncbi:hypothetical protein CDEF62S_02583 [Castellaniella defragrans]